MRLGPRELKLISRKGAKEKTQRRRNTIAPLRLSLRLCVKHDHRFCHCATTKQDVNFVCSLLINGSNFINGGAKNFLLPGGMRKINEFRTIRKATLPR